MAADERGVALPLTLVVLTLLTSLTLAFLALGATEPIVAANLQRSEEALTLAEAGVERAIWALSYPAASGITSPARAPYDGQLLAGLGNGAYTIAVTAGAGPSDRVLTAHGYVVRDGVTVPAQPAALVRADALARRVVQVQVTAGPNGTVGGPAAPSRMNLPGALTVAGSLEMSGNALVNGWEQTTGTPNGCARQAGVTIRDRTTLASGTEIDHTITLRGAAEAVGAPARQELAAADFAPYTFSAAQLAALKALAQQEGTYVQPTSGSILDLDVPSGLVFVDGVNGQDLGSPPDPSKLARVRMTGASRSGWLIVMGSLRIEGNTTYSGFIYTHGDLVYQGGSESGIFGAVLTGNATATGTTVIEGDGAGRARIYHDCTKVTTGGGALSAAARDGLNRVIVEVTKGTWRELPG